MIVKVTAGLLDKLLALMEGQSLPSSSFSSALLEALKEEGCVVVRTQGSRRTVHASDARSVEFFAKHRLGVSDIRNFRMVMDDKDKSRADLVGRTGDSKSLNSRGWKGFPLAVLEPLTVSYDGKPWHLEPTMGISLIVHEYQRLSIPGHVTVVGIENGESFMKLHEQRKFFERYTGTRDILFVSRYPQNGDIASWLMDKPNRYIHFGDLDIAGVAIYQNEFYRKLGKKASFLLPDDYDVRVKMGIPGRYDDQFCKYGILEALDPCVKPLLNCIYLYHKGYDQEGFIHKPFAEDIE